ncbi:hypothetical protein Tco_1569990 [Tanacetum coccineum]
MSTSEAPDLTHATIEELVAHSIVVILKAQAAMMASTNNPNSEPRKTSVARKCDYEKFTSYQLFYFNGTDGAVGLIRWFKRTESIFSHSKCAEVRFVVSTLTKEALFWWNSFTQSVGIEEAYKITWSEFKRLLIEKYCPQTEIKKIEEAVTMTQKLIKHVIEQLMARSGTDLKMAKTTRRITKPTSEQGFLSAVYKEKSHDTLNTCLYACYLSQIKPSSIAKALSDSSWMEAMKRAIGTKWVFRNKKDERGIVIRNKERIISTAEGRWNIINQDKYVDEILKKFNYTDVKSASTPVDLEKALFKDGDANDVDVHLYRSMIGSLMYLTTSRLDIMFAVCACARFQVTLKTSYLLVVKRIFRYLKGKPTLGLWYFRDSPFELVAYTDSDYARATQDRKLTTGGYLLTKGFDAGRQKEVGTLRYLSLVVHLKKVGDEVVHKELGDRIERAATTASSLEAEQESGSGPKCQDTILGDVDAQTRFETTSK